MMNEIGGGRGMTDGSDSGGEKPEVSTEQVRSLVWCSLNSPALAFRIVVASAFYNRVMPMGYVMLAKRTSLLDAVFGGNAVDRQSMGVLLGLGNPDETEPIGVFMVFIHPTTDAIGLKCQLKFFLNPGDIQTRPPACTCVTVIDAPAPSDEQVMWLGHRVREVFDVLDAGDTLSAATLSSEYFAFNTHDY